MNEGKTIMLLLDKGQLAFVNKEEHETLIQNIEKFKKLTNNGMMIKNNVKYKVNTKSRKKAKMAKKSRQKNRKK